MVERELEIVNRLGLHARAAAKLVHLTGRFASEVKLFKDGQSVDAKSILGILLLAAPQGTRLRLQCEGLDEQEAADAVAGLFAAGFEEEQ